MYDWWISTIFLRNPWFAQRFLHSCIIYDQIIVESDAKKSSPDIIEQTQMIILPWKFFQQQFFSYFMIYQSVVGTITIKIKWYHIIYVHQFSLGNELGNRWYFNFFLVRLLGYVFKTIKRKPGDNAMINDWSKILQIKVGTIISFNQMNTFIWVANHWMLIAYFLGSTLDTIF